MFKTLHDRADRALRSATARSSAEATYEAIRNAVNAAAPESDEEKRRLMLEALASRRAWKRISDSEFVCSFSNRAVPMHVPEPFDTDIFYKRIATAEVEAFLGDSEPLMLADLHMLAQRELRRLLDRDDPIPD
jgi:hypothetical protein